jgi:hypothetical protein
MRFLPGDVRFGAGSVLARCWLGAVSVLAGLLLLIVLVWHHVAYVEMRLLRWWAGGRERLATALQRAGATWG